MALNPIVIAGCGPGARACVTGEARAAIENAEVVIGVARLLELFPETDAVKVSISGHRAAAIAAIEEHRTQRMVVLVTGDPGLASLAAPIVAHFGLASCRILPGISSVQVAFARLGLEWEQVRILSAHAECPQCDIELLRRERALAFLSGGPDAQRWIAALAAELGADWEATVAQDLTLPGERIFPASPTELANLPQPLRAVIVLRRMEKP
jgi:cobalt-precorrin-7 (C5)-methyltransferase